MKKSLLSLVALVFWASVFFGLANALNISDIFSKDTPLVDSAYTQLLNNYNSDWWYNESFTLTCDTNDDGITIVSPTVEDSIYDNATSYRLILSPYRISKIQDGDSSVDISNIITKEEKLENNGWTITFKLSSSEIDSGKIYYGFVTPVDMYDEVWSPSKEVCFHMNSKMCLLDQDCDSLYSIVNPNPVVEPEDTTEPEPEDIFEEDTWEETHGAACVWMNLAHVTHTKNGNQITLKWTAVDGENVDIAIFNPEQEIYENLATVKMSDEKYVYNMRWSGEQNFMLTNDCGSTRYKADAAMWEDEPEIKATPATWPAENVLYIAIAAIILYGAYTIFFRKSDN